MIQRLVLIIAFCLCVDAAAEAAEQCRGSKIIRTCDLTHPEMMCSSDDSLCKFMAVSQQTKTCYSIKVPCSYRNTLGLFEGLKLLEYPIVGVEYGLPAH